MRHLARSLIILIAALTLAASAGAQAPAPPQGLTTQQFNAIVDAASQAAVEKLRASPTQATQADAQPDDIDSRVAIFINRAATALSATPGLGQQIGRIPSLLRGDSARSLATFLILVIATVLAALSVEWMLRAATAGLRDRLAAQADARAGFAAAPPLLWLAMLDLLGLGAVWLVSYGAAGLWFQGDSGQARLARLILLGVFAWRLYMVAFRIVLRPEQHLARLASISDRAARDIYARISLIVALAVALRAVILVLSAIGAAADEVAAAQIFGNLLLAVLLHAAWALRVPVALWFAGLGRRVNRRPLSRSLAVRWLLIAVPFFCLLFATQIYGAIMRQPSVPGAMVLTMNCVLGLIFFETLRAYLTRPPKPAVANDVAAIPQAGLLSSVILRCIRVAVLILVAATIIPKWIVDVFGLVDESAWRATTHISATASATVFFAYVAWEFVRYATDRYMTPARVGLSADEDAAPPPAASRLATLAPLLRVAAAIGIVLLAVLLVLTELGVNITPLIAGASVIGLAVSFGSQTLVRDIVSGMFYLADDAFRVGEYIDCGKAKGTVEGFTLRSIKLRHQSGQVHTIPFGQLGQITNFSRDWATVKFNLRLARDSDLEKVRKAVKKVGLEMLEDPEMKDEFLAPVKLQGIADILDHALVVRVKFTVKPQNPSFIQRQAVKRIVQAFAENDIAFASSTVAVQTVGEKSDPASAAGAAVAAARSRNLDIAQAG